MDTEQGVVYFNNCRNYNHARFGSGAFFDLNTEHQGKLARNLRPGQPCVVAKQSPDKRVAIIDWYSFVREEPHPDAQHGTLRVFFGQHLASETMAKKDAAISSRYAPLFKRNGDFKYGSVFLKTIPTELIPSGPVGGWPQDESGTPVAQMGAGFGDPAENKLVESAAVRAVVKHYAGWSVQSVERDKCGFDLECAKGDVVEQVEVKGVRGTGLCFVITAGEVRQARENAKFFLVVVTSALSPSPTLTKFSGTEFGQRFDLSAIQYRAALRQ